MARGSFSATPIWPCGRAMKIIASRRAPPLHWDGPILTDSAGIRFSACGLRKIDDGVVFRSHIDGQLSNSLPNVLSDSGKPGLTSRYVWTSAHRLPDPRNGEAVRRRFSGPNAPRRPRACGSGTVCDCAGRARCGCAGTAPGKWPSSIFPATLAALCGRTTEQMHALGLRCSTARGETALPDGSGATRGYPRRRCRRADL